MIRLTRQPSLLLNTHTLSHTLNVDQGGPNLGRAGVAVALSAWRRGRGRRDRRLASRGFHSPTYQLNLIRFRH